MADSKKISGLPETTSPSTSGVTVVVQDGVTYKTKLSNFRGAIASGATETSEGVARLATYAETSGGTDNTTIVTPAKLKYYNDLQSQENDPMDSRYYDGDYPWASTQSVNSGITSNSRYTGLTVNVNGYEYWYKNGISDSDLILKLNFNEVIISGYTIYVETTGSDTTGNGTLAAPFATLLKAIQSLEGKTISGTKMFIQLGAGNFEVNEDCLIAMQKVKSVFTGNLVISGTSVDSGTLTFTSLGMGRYTVSEGLSSEDQYYDYVMRHNYNRVYPIGKHDTSEIHLVDSGMSGAKTISQLQTTLTAKASIQGTPDTTGNLVRYSSNLLLQFGSVGQEHQNFGSAYVTYKELIIETDSSIQNQGNLHPVHLYSCILKPSTTFAPNNDDMFIYEVDPSSEGLSFRYSFVDISDPAAGINRLLYSYGASEHQSTRYYGDGTQDCFQFLYQPRFFNISNDVIDNFANGFISEYGSPEIDLYTSLYFLNCTTAFNWRSGKIRAIRRYSPEISLYNVDYLLRITKSENCQIYLPSASVTGTPNISWLHPSSVNDGYYNPSIQMDIIIPDIYREVDFINDTTLIDSGTTYTVVGDTSQNRSISIDYTIVRDTGYQAGNILILYDGSSVYYFDSAIDNGPDLGVTLTADISSTDIRLVATSTDTGNTSTFKGHVKRIMI